MPRKRITLNREQAQLADSALAAVVDGVLRGVAGGAVVTIDDVRKMVAAQNRIREQLDVP